MSCRVSATFCFGCAFVHVYFNGPSERISGRPLRPLRRRSLLQVSRSQVPKVAIVTGATGRLGAAVAKGLAEHFTRTRSAVGVGRSESVRRSRSRPWSSEPRGVCLKELLQGNQRNWRGPPVISALSHPFFGWEGSRTKVDYGKKGNYPWSIRRFQVTRTWWFGLVV